MSVLSCKKEENIKPNLNGSYLLIESNGIQPIDEFYIEIVDNKIYSYNIQVGLITSTTAVYMNQEVDIVLQGDILTITGLFINEKYKKK
jgi:hypothetical protein